MERRPKMGPLKPDHPLVDDPAMLCPACRSGFKVGEHVTLVNVGPGDDPEARQRCREGRPYTAVALPAHWACVTGEEITYDDARAQLRKEIIETFGRSVEGP